MPAVLQNTSLPVGVNYTITINNYFQLSTIHCKDVVINAGLTATLTDNVYQNITVAAGAHVLFSNNDLSIRSLTMKDGTGSVAALFTQASFSNQSNVVRVSYLDLFSGNSEDKKLRYSRFETLYLHMFKSSFTITKFFMIVLLSTER